MKYRIHITQQAEKDMDDTADYIRLTLLNPSAAFTLLLKARDVIHSLAAHPQRNQLVDDPVLASWGVRFAIVNHYLAFYVISEKEHTVHIIRFLYGKRNWMCILRQEFLSE